MICELVPKTIAGIAATAIVALTGSIQAAAMDVQVLVHNYAGVSGKSLEQAVAFASLVFQNAGIKTSWMQYPVEGAPLEESSRYQPLPGQVQLVIRLVPDSMVAGWAGKTEHLGYSLIPANGDSAYIGAVYSERAERLSVRNGCAPSLVLGAVIAHELGHLLLGANSHSPQGIMTFPLTGEPLRLAGQGMLRFNKEQLRRIREGLARRLSVAAVASGSGAGF